MQVRVFNALKACPNVVACELHPQLIVVKDNLTQSCQPMDAKDEIGTENW